MPRSERAGTQARTAFTQVVDDAAGHQPQRQIRAAQAQRILGVVIGQEKPGVRQAGGGDGCGRYQQADERCSVRAARRTGIDAARQGTFDAGVCVKAAPVARRDGAEFAHGTADGAGTGSRAGQRRDQGGQRIRPGHRIVVQQPDPVVSGGKRVGHAEGKAAGAAEVAFRTHDQRASLLAQPQGAVVEAGVVDHVNGIERATLHAQGRQHMLQQLRPVISDHDGGNAHGGLRSA
jgi:hypothetical protein